MIIAITGATSFISQRLIDRHLKRGDVVRYLTRTNSIPIKNATAFIGDVNAAPEMLLPFLDSVDILYHCAAEIKNESVMYRTNVEGTSNLLGVAAKCNIARWVQLSSTGVYGVQTDTVVVEDTLPRPHNVYEVSKLEADNLVLDMVKKCALDAIIIRPTNVYGPTMTNQALFGLIRAIHKGFFFFIGKKGAVANYIHVENLVDAMLLASLSNKKTSSNIYIVSDHCSMERFVKFIATALDVRTPVLRLPKFFVRIITAVLEHAKISPLTSSRIDALTRTTVYSSDKITKELGYVNKVTIEDGVTELVNFWSKSRKQ